MARRPIVHYPHPVLKKKMLPVTEFNSDLASLAKDMLETMYVAPGVGLAANQIGELKSIAVIDVSEKANEPLILVNPSLQKSSGRVLFEEGCLSIPGFTDKVNRFTEVWVSYQNLKGEKQEIHGTDLLAIVLQHEIDHLNGILYIDRLSSLKKSLIKKKIARAKKENQ